MPKTKTLALIAHDAKKHELIAFANRHIKWLKKFKLVGTKTTAAFLTRETQLKIHPLLSGPMGGDLQVGSLVASGKVDILIFFRDPLTAQPHDPDINALVRICDVHNVPVATNPATAHCIIKSL
ncbi:MAG: methylglyoxal synthase [Deltaproteobacteria bacterium]|nr:methylglyoxal synthase [Deltaproteobacteria bacterium]